MTHHTMGNYSTPPLGPSRGVFGVCTLGLLLFGSQLGSKGARFNWGNIRVILGLYWDNGKENGNYYTILGVILG